MSAINPAVSYQDLNLNLKDLEDTLQNRPHLVDRDYACFIEILANDLQELQKTNFDNSKIHALTARLEQTADRIYAVVFKDNHSRPKIGPVQQISDVATQMSQGLTKSGLEELNPLFMLRRIAGDGHCLFRACAVGLLDYLSTLQSAQKHDYIVSLQKHSPDCIEEIKNLLLLPKEEAYQQSEVLVAYLRKLACSQMQKSDNEVLKANILSEEYLKNMASMQKGEHGGEPELVALGQALELDLRVVDAIVIGKAQQTAASYLQAPAANTVFLLHTPMHYDILYAR